MRCILSECSIRFYGVILIGEKDPDQYFKYELLVRTLEKISEKKEKGATKDDQISFDK